MITCLPVYVNVNSLEFVLSLHCNLFFISHLKLPELITDVFKKINFG